LSPGARLDGNRVTEDMLETRKGEMPHVVPPSLPLGQAPAATPLPGLRMAPSAPMAQNHYGPPPPLGPMPPQPYGSQLAPMQTPYPQMQMGPGMVTYPQASNLYGGGETVRTRDKSNRWVYWLIGLLVIGGIAGAAVALLMNR